MTIPPVRKGFLPLLMLITWIGAGLRVLSSHRVGLGYDEVYVVAMGLDQALATPNKLWFEIPLQRSNAITPLWWWLLAAPVSMFGLNATSIRLLPCVLSVIAIPAVGWLTAQRFGRSAGLFVAGLLCTNDIVIFCAARPEYAETLLVPLALVAMSQIGSRAALVRGLVWALILFTALTKGLFLIAGLAIAELLARNHREWAAAWRSMLTSLSVAIAPCVVWLLLANASVFGNGPIQTDAGVFESAWQLTMRQIRDYRELKPQMVGAPRDAALVYLDAFVWPTTALLTPSLLLLAAMNIWSKRRWKLGLFPLVLGGMLLVIIGGRLGARFHLLYLPALWFTACVTYVPRTKQASTLVALSVLVGATALGTLSVGHWSDGSYRWTQGLPWAVGCLAFATCGLMYRGNIRVANWTALAILTTALAALGMFGPLRWGPTARFEPIPGHGSGNPETPGLLSRLDDYRIGRAPFPPPNDRRLSLSMAHALLVNAPDEQATERAVAYAAQATRNEPDNWQTWFYLGLTRQRSGMNTESIRNAWQKAYRLSPTEGLARRIADLEKTDHE